MADELREQDRLLPIANVSRIMKRCVPAAAKIAQPAKDLLQESVSEFISFITSEAVETCVHDKRKTVTDEDFIQAAQRLGYAHMVPHLEEVMRRQKAGTK